MEFKSLDDIYKHLLKEGAKQIEFVLSPNRNFYDGEDLVIFYENNNVNYCIDGNFVNGKWIVKLS